MSWASGTAFQNDGTFFSFFFHLLLLFFSISLRAIFGQQSINTSTGFSVYFSSLDLWKQVMLSSTSLSVLAGWIWGKQNRYKSTEPNSVLLHNEQMIHGLCFFLQVSNQIIFSHKCESGSFLRKESKRLFYEKQNLVGFLPDIWTHRICLRFLLCNRGLTHG